MQKILVIVGPTAVGKTNLSLKLAQKFNGEIISGDSMQVYKYLNIGTAKINPKQMQGINHHLIDTQDVYHRYSAADFVHDATSLINNINKRGKLPIIVGGTGFYLQALINNLSLGGKNNINYKLRDELNNLLKHNGKKYLWKKLYNIDPASAKKISFNNTRRIIRALEVYYNNGILFSKQSNNQNIDFNSFIIGLNTDRRLLYNRINKRVNLMINNGLLNEARWLFHLGGISLPASKGIGYHELFKYFKKQQSLDDSINLIKKDSRHYAKRQLTWFRNKMDVNWYNLIQHPQDLNKINKDVLNWIKL